MIELKRDEYLEEDEEITEKEIMLCFTPGYLDDYLDDNEEFNYPLYSDDEIYKEYVYLDDLTEEELFKNNIYYEDR